MSDELQKIASAFEVLCYEIEKYTCVCIEPSGVHVNNPPKESGFEHGKDMTKEEFIRRAKAFIERTS